MTFVIVKKVFTFDGDQRTNADLISEAWDEIKEGETVQPEFRASVSEVLESKETDDV